MKINLEIWFTYFKLGLQILNFDIDLNGGQFQTEE